MTKEETKEYNRIYREKNKETINEKRRVKYHKDGDEIRERSSEYYKNNKDKVAASMKKYKEENIYKVRAYNNQLSKTRKATDPVYRLSHNLRVSINTAIRKMGFTKKSKTNAVLSCSFEDFKVYLESKFEPWMNWENYGRYNGEINYGWDIDHIIPLVTAETEEDVIKLNHYTNLQPLCSYVNRVVKNVIKKKKQCIE